VWLRVVACALSDDMPAVCPGVEHAPT
jgi:hypothetical protein